MKIFIRQAAAAVLAALLLLLCGCGGASLYAAAAAADEGHVHLFSSSIKPATCAEASCTVYSCECGRFFSYPLGKPLPHTFSGWETKTPETCIAQGESGRRCTVCGYTESAPIPARGHSFGEWGIAVAATPAADGLSRRVCETCGLVEEQLTPATGSVGLEIDGGTVLEIGTCTDTELYIPTVSGKADVTAVADRAFVNCANITSVFLSKNVVTVGYRAFYNCPALTAVTVPASVKAIGQEAFGGCAALKHIYFYGTKDGFDRLFANAALPAGVTVVYKQP